MPPQSPDGYSGLELLATQQSKPRKWKVFHVITKLELGGAQKVTLMTLERLPLESYRLGLVTGPGGLLTERAESIPDLKIFRIPSLSRDIRPVKDVRAFLDLYLLFRQERPDIVHTHSSESWNPRTLGRVAGRGSNHLSHRARFRFQRKPEFIAQKVFDMARAVHEKGNDADGCRFQIERKDRTEASNAQGR